QRVDRAVVDAEFVKQVRAGRPAGRTHIADQLALLDVVAFFQALGETALVGVQRGVLAEILQDDDVAVAALFADERDGAVGGGADGCPRRGGVVHAFVAGPALVDGMLAHAEPGADAGEFDGVAQEGALEAGAGKIVIAAGILALLEPARAVGLVLVDEFQGADAAGTDRFAVVHIGVVDDADPVALAQVLEEVEPAAQDVHHFQGDGVRHLGLVGGAEQGTGDFALGDAGFGGGGCGAFLGGHAAAGLALDLAPGRLDTGVPGHARASGRAPR